MGQRVRQICLRKCFCDFFPAKKTLIFTIIFICLINSSNKHSIIINLKRYHGHSRGVNHYLKFALNIPKIQRSFDPSDNMSHVGNSTINCVISNTLKHSAADVNKIF